MKNKYMILGLALVCLCLFSGCVEHNALTDVTRVGIYVEPVGFWHGLWHGICAPWAFWGIMFGLDIGVYESYNNGNWYNFGFLLGVGGLFGGCRCSRKNRN